MGNPLLMVPINQREISPLSKRPRARSLICSWAGKLEEPLTINWTLKMMMTA